MKDVSGLLTHLCVKMSEQYTREFYTSVDMIPSHRHHINKCVTFDTDIIQFVREKQFGEWGPWNQN